MVGSSLPAHVRGGPVHPRRLINPCLVGALNPHSHCILRREPATKFFKSLYTKSNITHDPPYLLSPTLHFLDFFPYVSIPTMPGHFSSFFLLPVRTHFIIVILHLVVLIRHYYSLDHHNHPRRPLLTSNHSISFHACLSPQLVHYISPNGQCVCLIRLYNMCKCGSDKYQY